MGIKIHLDVKCIAHKNNTGRNIIFLCVEAQFTCFFKKIFLRYICILIQLCVHSCGFLLSTKKPLILHGRYLASNPCRCSSRRGNAQSFSISTWLHVLRHIPGSAHCDQCLPKHCLESSSEDPLNSLDIRGNMPSLSIPGLGSMEVL